MNLASSIRLLLDDVRFHGRQDRTSPREDVKDHVAMEIKALLHDKNRYGEFKDDFNGYPAAALPAVSNRHLYLYREMYIQDFAPLVDRWISDTFPGVFSQVDGEGLCRRWEGTFRGHKVELSLYHLYFDTHYLYIDVR